jgi:hypothetical protein
MIRNSYVPPETYNIAEWAAAKTESRFLMIPQGFGFWIDYENKPNSDVYLYDVYLMPHYFKKENYYGWFGEAAPRPDIYDKITFRCTQSRSIGELAGSLSLNGNIIFTKMKTCTIEAKPEEFCSVLKEGAVDHVFVNRNFPEVIAYADSAGCLVKDGELKQLVSYAVAGHKKYADGTEGYVKKDGVISLKVEGQMNGTLIVRESYYPYWKAYVDGKEAKPEKSEYGFISVPIDAREGSHAVVLEYKPEKYNGLFSFVSAIAWIAALTVLIKPDVLDKMARKKK